MGNSNNDLLGRKALTQNECKILSIPCLFYMIEFKLADLEDEDQFLLERDIEYRLKGKLIHMQIEIYSDWKNINIKGYELFDAWRNEPYKKDGKWFDEKDNSLNHKIANIAIKTFLIKDISTLERNNKIFEFIEDDYCMSTDDEAMWSDFYEHQAGKKI